MTTVPISFIPTVDSDSQRHIATLLQSAGQSLIGILKDGLDRSRFSHRDGPDYTFFDVCYLPGENQKQQLIDLTS